MKKFKLDDWVVRSDPETTILGDISVAQIIEWKGTTYKLQLLSGGYINYESDQITIWKPEIGDYNWFWNSFGEPVLGKLQEIDSFGDEPDKYSVQNPVTRKYEFYDYCEPFIGALPSFVN